MEQAKKKRKIPGWVIAALLSVVVIVVLAFVLFKYFIGPHLLENKQVAIAHPAIFVQEPAEGDTFFENEMLTASATTTSTNTITRMELWVNGEKLQEQLPQGLVNTFYAAFEIALPEGDHLLVFRGVDKEGLVAQSNPVTVIIEPGFAELEVDEGVGTLDEIARALGEPPDTIKDLNPGLGDGNLPEGTKVKVPPPPPPEGGAIIVGPADEEPGKGNVIDISGLYQVGEKKVSWGMIDMVIAAIADLRPNAPSSFNAGYDDCVIQLRWQDNAEDETHFNIWMQRVYGPPQLIASTGSNPENGPTSFTFNAPRYGFYNFWVEAANPLGGQVSEIKEVFVSDQGCGGAQSIATHLEIKALDMYTYGSAQGYYCYLSVDGTDYQRIPEGDQIIQVQNNWGDIAKHWGGDKRMIFPMPEDEVLTLEGNCMAKLGPLMVAPINLFKVDIPREKWDGSRLEIKTSEFLIGYSVKPFGSETAGGRFEFVDYDLPRPDLWNVEAQGELQFPEKDWKARTVTLTWHWAGNPEKIQNFVIRIDGKDFRHVSKLQRQESILLGSACGEDYSFEVIAVGPGGARSVPSNSYLYKQPACPVMAEVQFLTIKSDAVDDTDCIPPLMNTCLPYTANSCHAIGVKYEIWAMAEGQQKIKENFGSSTIPIHYECGIEYQFSNQMRADPDTILVPISPSSTTIHVGTTFWDIDGGGNDTFAVTDEMISFSYEEWPTVDQLFTFKVPFMSDTADATVKIRVRGFYQPGP